MFNINMKKFFDKIKLKTFFHSLSYYFTGLLKRIDEHNIFLSGAGIAYSLLLSLIPLILFIFSLLGNIFEPDTLNKIINDIIETLIPYPTYSDYVKNIIRTRLPQVIVYKNIAGYVGIIGLLLTSTWIFSSMRTLLNQIYQTNIKKNALIGLIRDVGMVFLLIIFISLSTLIFPVLNLFFEIARNSPLSVLSKFSEVWDSIVRFSTLLIMLILFFILYYLIPYEKIPKRVAAVSAISTTILWELARMFFGYYIQNFLGTNPFYGAFILIIVILFWVFYSSCIFIVGAEIGQLFREKLILRKEQNEKT